MNSKWNETLLTAYVLGELEADEARFVEQYLEEHPHLEEELEEIRRTAHALSHHFETEEPLALTSEQRLKIKHSGGFNGHRWYLYPAAAAAAVLVLSLSLWYFQDGQVPHLSESSGTTQQVLEPAPPASPKPLPKATLKGSEPANRSPGTRPEAEGAALVKKQAPLEQLKKLPKQKPSIAAESASSQPADASARRPAENTLSDKTAQMPAPPPAPEPAAPVPGQGMTSGASRASGSGTGIAAPIMGRGLSAYRLVAPLAEARPASDQPPDFPRRPRHFNTEAYDRLTDNPFIRVSEDPLSTFSIDVDTASYANVRRFLSSRKLPPKDAVRIEELVNYFSYDYSPPQDDRPFAVHVEAAAAPWNPQHRLLRIGLKGKQIDMSNRPAGNLVFLLDVSGSMQPYNKLPLLKRALHLLVEHLGTRDRVAIVVYAGASGLVLPSTSCERKEEIFQALDRLRAGGSTNGAAGIQLAYQTAAEHLVKGGMNRVILATDGDFNVGITNQGDLTRLIEKEAKRGIFLSVLGFGMGNYKDSTLEKLADRGNGNYAYIDSLQEAKKVLVEEVGGTLVTIAKDVKIQLEFNPLKVQAFRLIGYENRLLQHQDFNDDSKDAGEIGAGHTVTALYELIPPGLKVPGASVDPLKYQSDQKPTPAARKGELLTVKLRYKEPREERSRLFEIPVRDSHHTFEQASGDLQFAAAVAEFGMLLRDSPYKANSSFNSVLQIAEGSLGQDPGKRRHEFLTLVKTARALTEIDDLREHQ